MNSEKLHEVAQRIHKDSLRKSYSSVKLRGYFVRLCEIAYTINFLKPKIVMKILK